MPKILKICVVLFKVNIDNVGALFIETQCSSLWILLLVSVIYVHNHTCTVPVFL